MFERPHEPLLPRPRLVLRMAKFCARAAVIDGLAVPLGAVGYRVSEGLGWLDATVNAAMGLSQISPAAESANTDGSLLGHEPGRLAPPIR